MMHACVKVLAVTALLGLGQGVAAVETVRNSAQTKTKHGSVQAETKSRGNGVAVATGRANGRSATARSGPAVKADAKGENDTASGKVPAPAIAPGPAECPSVLDIAQDTPDLATLVTLIEAAGLADAVSNGEDALTVFAPTNAAIEALGSDTLDKLGSDQAALAKILMGHVVDVAAKAADLTDGQSLNTFAGAPITISLADGGVAVQAAGCGTTATVVTADVMACNSVVHVIDAVLVAGDGCPEEPEKGEETEEDETEEDETEKGEVEETEGPEKGEEMGEETEEDETEKGKVEEAEGPEEGEETEEDETEKGEVEETEGPEKGEETEEDETEEAMGKKGEVEETGEEESDKDEEMPEAEEDKGEVEEEEEELDELAPTPEVPPRPKGKGSSESATATDSDRASIPPTKREDTPSKPIPTPAPTPAPAPKKSKKGRRGRCPGKIRVFVYRGRLYAKCVR